VAAIFVYWLLALAVYGWVLFQMVNDPTYDW
jgi:hypothetical protein